MKNVVFLLNKMLLLGELIIQFIEMDSMKELKVPSVLQVTTWKKIGIREDRDQKLL